MISFKKQFAPEIPWLVNNPDGTLFGMYDAADLIAYLRTLDRGAYQTLEEMLIPRR